MKLAAPLLFFILVACNQNSSKEKDIEPADTTKKDVSVPADTIVSSTLAADMNAQLEKDFPGQWKVVDDRVANWPKDQFDYFIAAKRKDNPDYPYITQGDFDGDSKKDIAALVVDPVSSKYFNIVIQFAGNNKSVFWKEDVLGDAALSTTAPAEIDGMDGENTKKVKLKWEAINVEYFERAAFILYWDGKQFRRLQTGD